MGKIIKNCLILSLFALSTAPVFADSELLTPQENLWLKSRNNTIIVYPEKNSPPYSYQNSSGKPQGLAIDYLELISKKLGFNIEYLPPRPLSQILDDVKESKKGDVIAALTDTKQLGDLLYYSDVYINIPAVIITRKDINNRHDLTLEDLSGKKVAIGDRYPVEDFVKSSHPLVIIESVVDDESGLQQVVLGDVDAAIMDLASFSHYLSMQILSSVKLSGNTGFEYKPAFAFPKDREILQSIIDKGLHQIGAGEKKLLIDKWITIPETKDVGNSFFYKTNAIWIVSIFVISIAVIIAIVILIRKKHFHIPSTLHKRSHVISELKAEMEELEDTSRELVEELNEVKELERDIKEKIKNIET